MLVNDWIRGRALCVVCVLARMRLMHVALGRVSSGWLSSVQALDAASS